MASSTIWKPSTINSWKGGIAFLADSAGTSEPPVVTLPNGQQIVGKYVNTNEGRKQWIFPKELAGLQNIQLSYGGQTTTLENGSMSYEGSNLGSMQARSKGSLGGGGLTGGIGNDPGFNLGGGVPGQFAPNNVGGFGFAPAYLGGQFPSPTFSTYTPTQTAPYNFTDAKKFAKAFGQFNREEIGKNFDLSKDLALDTLNTELSTLQSFVPAAAALKRSETSIDNTFNQAERTRQIESGLPGVRTDLDTQAGRARSLASGQLPSSIEDKALSVALGSESADRSAQGGFGQQSSVARKASALLSAKERLNISQYGDSLLTNNIQTKANLLLAPTEYSNAGSQVNVNPSVSPAQLISSNLSQTNALTTVPTSQALGQEIQQQQFSTTLEQGNRQFNASNELQNSQFNSGISNSFALQKFGYDVGFAGTVAGAAQTSLNTQIALEQQKQHQEIFQDAMRDAQTSQQIGEIGKGIGAILGGITSLMGGKATTGDTVSSDDAGDAAGAAGNSSSDSTGASGAGRAAGSVGASSDSGPTFTGEGVDTSLVDEPDSSGSSGGSSSDSVNFDPLSPEQTGENDEDDSFAIDREPSLKEFAEQTGTDYSTSGIKAKSLKLSSDRVMNTAGLYKTPGTNTVPAGVNNQGQQLYADKNLAASNDPKAGQTFVQGLGAILSPFNIFGKEDQARFAEIGQIAGDAATAAKITQQIQAGDKTGAINTILTSLKQPTIDKFAKDKNDKAGITAGFQAAQLVNNWGNMSGAQRALGIASIGINGFRSATGENLAAKAVLTDANLPGGKLTVGQTLGLFQQGINVYSLVENWNSLSTAQKVAGGALTAKSAAEFAKNNNMLGFGTTGAAIKVNPAQLAQAGFKPTPGMGVGAITGADASKLPAGYSIVSTNKDGSVTAIPTPNKGSSFLTDGVNIATVGLGALQVQQNWGKGGAEGAYNGAMGGSAVVAGLEQMGTSNPYLLGGILAASIIGGGMKKGAASTALEVGTGAGIAIGAYQGLTGAGAAAGAAAAGTQAAAQAGAGAAGAAAGGAGAAGEAAGSSFGSYLGAGVAIAGGVYRGAKILGSDLTAKQKAVALRETVRDTAAAYYTLGLSSLVQFADAKWGGGRGAKLLSKLEKTNVGNYINDAIMTEAIKLTGGKKSGAQQGRDSMRMGIQKTGLADEKFNVTLADGSKADVGIDGHGGKHGIADSSKLAKDHEGIKDLNAWDIDYTNDLDYVSGMGSIALTRLLAGGKSVSTDQMGGQLGNAALKNVGYGKPMTQENFNKVIANQRAFYSQSGIKSKEQAYALANEAFSQKRIDAADHAAALQAANMIFDPNGYDTARKLMAGRFQGINAVAQEERQPIMNVPVNRKPLQFSGQSVTNNQPVTAGNAQTADLRGAFHFTPNQLGRGTTLPQVPIVRKPANFGNTATQTANAARGY